MHFEIILVIFFCASTYNIYDYNLFTDESDEEKEEK